MPRPSGEGTTRTRAPTLRSRGSLTEGIQPVVAPPSAILTTTNAKGPWAAKACAGNATTVKETTSPSPLDSTLAKSCLWQAGQRSWSMNATRAQPRHLRPTSTPLPALESASPIEAASARGVAAFTLDPPEHMDGARAAGCADVVRKAALRALPLPRAGAPVELLEDLNGLSHARRADGVALRLQPAGRVHGQVARQRCKAVDRGLRALPFLDEPEVLDCEHFRDREAVVDLGEVHIFRPQAGLGERLGGRLPRAGDLHERRARRELRGRAAPSRPEHLHAADAPRPCNRLGDQEDGRGAVGERAAVVELERPGHVGRLEHLLDGDCLVQVRVGVGEGILVVLHRDMGKLLFRGAILVEVGGG